MHTSGDSSSSDEEVVAPASEADQAEAAARRLEQRRNQPRNMRLLTEVEAKREICQCIILGTIDFISAIGGFAGMFISKSKFCDASIKTWLLFNGFCAYASLAFMAYYAMRQLRKNF